jgi:hypothetical protein
LSSVDKTDRSRALDARYVGQRGMRGKQWHARVSLFLLV